VHSHAQVGVAISGIAGPSGGTLDKPVGTVWIAYASEHNTYAQRYYFSGNRNSIREQSVITALRQLYSVREQTFRQKFRSAKLLPEKLF
jgi:nicotinamide-nucleotide amidase